MMSKVSIMMPVYNGMPLIKKSIESILAQTYQNWECIIIDDGSNDGTSEYIETLTDPRFIIEHFKVNRGRPVARQRGLDMASGEYVAMLDAEDLYHPEKLEIQVAILDRHPNVALVGAGMCSFGSQVDFIRIRGKGDSQIHKYQDSNKPFPISHAPSLLRRSIASQFKYNPELQLGEDVDYLKRYLDGREYIKLDSVLYYYSEFDSVTKQKIMRTYWLELKQYIKEKMVLISGIIIVKMFVFAIYSSFVTIEYILSKRGAVPTMKEQLDFDELMK